MKKWFIVALVACISAAAVQAGEGGGKKGKGGGDWDLNRFIEMQKKRAEKMGTEFDQAAAEARFAKKDKNGDGILTKEERQAKGGNKKKQAKADDSE